jgi:uridine kinase
MNEKAPHTETERKYLPLFPEKLRRFVLKAYEIEQMYMSHPSEEYSLRIRRTFDGTETLTPTIKDAGTMTADGLSRMEIDGNISRARYKYYRYHSTDAPYVYKQRFEPIGGVVIDYYPTERGLDHIQLESEDPAAWQQFLETYGYENDFTEVTGDRIANNEWRAHYDYRRRNLGREALKPDKELEAGDMVEEIMSSRRGEPLTVMLGGRSGSGKTTLLSEVKARLHDHGVTTSTVSIDDYIKSTTVLHEMGGGSWPNFDANEAYDLSKCHEDLRTLRTGQKIPKRVYSFETGEPSLEGHVMPAEVTIAEGIKAHHPEFRNLADLSFVIPTPLATALGRRIKRDLLHRPHFSGVGDNLTYYLEYAEPEYRALLES